MPFQVIVTRDFDHMSEVAAEIATGIIQDALRRKDACVLGLATGNSPTGLYKHLAKSANNGAFPADRVRTFNLDEYVGLPGENAQQRALHPQSYSFFMVQELFGLLTPKFAETNVPWGTVVEQDRLTAEMDDHPGDWEAQGQDTGKAIVIRPDAASAYLRWVRREVLDAYDEKIASAGGMDLHIIGVGGRGHVAFHESGIPFAGNRMLLVQLDDSTVNNAVADGHFPDRSHCPRYAISMGAELVYEARTVLLLANGARKALPVADALLLDPTPLAPLSYSHRHAQRGGRMICVLDREAAEPLFGRTDALQARGIFFEDRSAGRARVSVADLAFRRDPSTGQWA